jgi:hypothetical protein
MSQQRVKQRAARSLIFGAIALLAATLLWSSERQRKLTSDFERLQIGEAESAVAAKLGKPWKIGRCGQVFGGDADARCAIEYLYASPYAPLDPEYWAFRFNEGGRVVDKERYVSP